MAKVGTAEYDVEISKAKLKGEVDHASKTIEQGLGGSAQKVKSQFSGIGGSIVLGLGFKAAIGEFEEAQKVGAQTAAVIKSTGNAAEVSAAQQDKMVQSLSDLAAIDDEVIAGGANVLRTFTNIKGAETFEKALGAATDLSAAMGTDLQGSIVLVGKALNDPIKGLSALSRVGVSFTAQQKEQIKALAESGDALGAQKLILAELEKEFGGSAEANVTSTAKMKVAFGNAAEAVGGILAPALGLAATVAEKASTAFQALPAPLQALALGGAAGAIVWIKYGDAIGGAARKVTGSARTISQGLDGIASTRGISKGQAAIEALKSSVSGLGPAMVLGGAAAVGLGLTLYGLADNERQASKRAAELASGIKSIRDEAEATGKSVKDVFEAKTLVDFASKNADALDGLGLSITDVRDAVEGSDAEFEAFINKVLGNNASAGEVGLTHDLDLLRKELNGATSETKAAGSARAKLGIDTDKAKDATKGAAEAEQTYSEKLRESVGAAQAASAARQAVTAAEEARNDAVVGVADAQKAEEQAQRAVTQAVRGADAAQRSLADARRAVGDAERGVEQALRGEEAARRGLAEAEKAGAEARQAVVDRTEDLAQAVREAAGDSDAMRDALAGVARAEVDLEARQADSLTAQQDLTDARNDYEHTLRNLSDAAGGAADDVLSAEIRLRRAQESLATLGAPDRNGNVDPVTADDVLAAQIAIRDAERAVRAAQDQAAAAAADLARNQANGVEGSDAVVAASEAVTQARDDETAAHLALEGAVQNVATTQEAADARVVEAHAALTAAVDAVGAANQRIIDARQAVVDAQDATRDAVRAVGDAQQNVKDQTEAVALANEAIVTAKEGVVQAHEDTEEAVKGVYEKTRDLADAQFAADGNLQNYITNLGHLRDELNPGTALRRDLDTFIADLERRDTLLSGAQPVVPPTRDPDRGPGSVRTRPQLTVINGLGEGSTAPRPRLRSADGGSGASTPQIVFNDAVIADAIDLEVVGRQLSQRIQMEAAV